MKKQFPEKNKRLSREFLLAAREKLRDIWGEVQSIVACNYSFMHGDDYNDDGLALLPYVHAQQRPEESF